MLTIAHIVVKEKPRPASQRSNRGQEHCNMKTLSPLGARGKSEPFTTPFSTGTATDGGWRAWWREQSVIDHTDWQALLAGAETSLRRLRAVHGRSS
jgi:hypothetical protein